MTRHDRLIKALKEIKDICVKNEDPEFGCGKKCPFLLGKEGDDFRDCEVVIYTRMGSHTVLDSPMEWDEDETELEDIENG